MTKKALGDVLEADPFEPVTLHLADGRRFAVDTPHMVAFLGTGRTLVSAHPGAERLARCTPAFSCS